MTISTSNTSQQLTQIAKAQQAHPTAAAAAKAQTQVKENSTNAVQSVSEGVKARNAEMIKNLGVHLNAKA